MFSLYYGKKILLFLVIVSIFALSANVYAANPYQLTIVYTNDVRGSTDPCG